MCWNSSGNSLRNRKREDVCICVPVCTSVWWGQGVDFHLLITKSLELTLRNKRFFLSFVCLYVGFYYGSICLHLYKHLWLFNWGWGEQEAVSQLSPSDWRHRSELGRLQWREFTLALADTIQILNMTCMHMHKHTYLLLVRILVIIKTESEVAIVLWETRSRKWEETGNEYTVTFRKAFWMGRGSYFKGIS